MTATLLQRVPSYPKVWNLGHAETAGIFDGPVLIQEKIDGSQISFGVFNGELMVRSKKQQLVIEQPEGMFEKAVEVIRESEAVLRPGYVYRGEYLDRPKHNVLAYDRVPTQHIALFDVQSPEGVYTSTPTQLQDLVGETGFEQIPDFGSQFIREPAELLELLQNTSTLGGQKIEGVVCKRYDAITRFGDPVFGKFVSQEFREVHSNDWKKNNPRSKDIVELLGEKYKTEARWFKAVIHLRERGVLENSPRDIANLINEIKADVLSECGDEIKDALFKYAWPSIQRRITAGMPEWYKDQLLKQAFEGGK